MNQKGKSMSFHRSCHLALRFDVALGAAILALASACAPQAAPSGWVPIEATLSVEHLSVPAPAEAAEPISMPLADARSQMPFAFGLPARTPEGFTLQDEVEAVLPTDSSPDASVTLTWQNAEDDMIALQVSVKAERGSQFAGAGTTEQVLVNGQPATLTRLGLKSTPRRLSLSWGRDGVTYTLTAEGGVLSAEALIGMAESIQP
jgi:uncharacterized protein DUF4367